MRAIIAVLAILATYCGNPLFAQKSGVGDSPRQTEPKAITMKSPHYPAKALEAGTEGMVYVSVLIDATGRVTKAKIKKSTAAIFDSAAVAAAKGSTFTPATKDGKPVDAWVTLPYKFKLSDKKTK